MSYLYPPPGDAPVVVMKDVGGYVDQYGAQTERYLASNREVRLHECRSACTLALSLPNVCVYPSSILKFHKAYNPVTKNANEEISEAMMAAYPPAVRQRLGELTRQYKVLTGSELIRLGIRDCDAPREPRILIARAKRQENPPQNPVSNAFEGLVAALAPQPAPGAGTPVKIQTVRAQFGLPAGTATPPAGPATSPTLPAEANGANPAESPTPPPRPAELAVASATAVAPATPQPRPDLIAAVAPKAPYSNWGRPIRGAAPILVSARFAPFPYRLASRN
ncbi:hypothetical protein [uncultured Rhodoblastus sp.]|uniref:hypothetical protein n=1 Tax=uncultured Rhodoblastus sp. TaxID=543037 RepID=UPI0025F70510|nr:hypothetical protein [uncultured Rhodoblastus sp.]